MNAVDLLFVKYSQHQSRINLVDKLWNWFSILYSHSQSLVFSEILVMILIHLFANFLNQTSQHSNSPNNYHINRNKDLS